MSMEAESAIKGKTESNAPVETENQTEEGQQPKLSKKQQNRLKWRERWLEKRPEKREKERERRKLKRTAMKEAGKFDQLKRKKGKKMADSKSKQRIVVDMSFDNLMIEKDIKRAVRQINWCYTANRHAEEPFQFHVVGFNGPSKAVYDQVEGSGNQDIHLHDKKLDEVFSPSEIVYLTAESDNVLETLDDSKVYVIGGLVDHNGHKGLCHSIAIEKKYQHARLPIDELFQLKTRRVLTINQVYEILVHFGAHHNWREALLSTVPERKGLKTKEEDDKNPENQEEPKASETVNDSECQDKNK